MGKRSGVIQVGTEAIAESGRIESLIVEIRGQQVMLDRDLASLYGVETKVLNQAVKRNINRFPDHFRFQLTEYETNELVTNCDRLQNLKHSSIFPFVFTEQGVAMLSTVLRSDTAISMSIQIMDAFVAMRHFIASNAQIFQRLEIIEHHQLELAVHQSETDRKLEEVFKRLDDSSIQKRHGIFFDGEIFDAYSLTCQIIKTATKRIVLFDNYIDETVLTLLDKRNAGVAATIYTQRITQQLKLDIVRHNSQYPAIDVRIFDRSHDRFLCIDDTVYHIGASLKDLGKKWFAFSRMELPTDELISKI